MLLAVLLLKRQVVVRTHTAVASSISLSIIHVSLFLPSFLGVATQSLSVQLVT